MSGLWSISWRSERYRKQVAGNGWGYCKPRALNCLSGEITTLHKYVYRHLSQVHTWQLFPQDFENAAAVWKVCSYWLKVVRQHHMAAVLVSWIAMERTKIALVVVSGKSWRREIASDVNLYRRRNLVCCIFTESMPKFKAIWKFKIPASCQFILHRTRKSTSVDILLENMQISNHVWCQQLLLKHWIAGTVYPLFLWHLIQKIKLFLRETEFETLVYKMATIFLSLNVLTDDVPRLVM